MAFVNARALSSLFRGARGGAGRALAAARPSATAAGTPGGDDAVRRDWT